MKIYTRKGDGGETGLLGGVRVAKNHARVEAYGAVDEVNAHIGQAVASLSGGLSPAAASLRDMLVRIQRELFELGADLATPPSPTSKKGSSEAEARITDDLVSALERDIDVLEERLEPLTTFILPSGGVTAAALHVARTVCRRAERRLVTLASAETVPAVHVRYLNRLSDFLFVAARAANRVAGIADVKVDVSRS